MIDSVRNARGYALRLLGYRGRSERELRDRLTAKGFSDETVAQTVTALLQTGLINDTILAEHAKRQALQDKLLSYEGTRRFLSRKGIPKEVIEATVAYDEDSEYENARRLLEKRLRFQKNGIRPQDRKRLWNFLVRRGFSFEVIKKAMKQGNFVMEDET